MKVQTWANCLYSGINKSNTYSKELREYNELMHNTDSELIPGLAVLSFEAQWKLDDVTVFVQLP